MPTFTVFNIGTGHGRIEQYNLLSHLFYEDTAAIEVGRRLDWAAQPDVKLINDGPAFGWDHLSELLHAADAMNGKRNATVNFITTWCRTKANPVVNLVGHSRGAILCVMIAKELRRIATCNLFLIDPVSMSTVGEDVGQTLYENTVGCCRITMEDDGNRIFPLQAITRGGGGGAITHIRLPGTHGTATQYSPRQGKDLPVKERASAATAWPIAGAARLEILRKLTAWGTPLQPDSATEAGNGALLVNTYSRIISANEPQRQRGPNFGLRAWINNLEPCTPGTIQKCDWVDGIRTANGLTSFSCANTYRGGPFFVNDQHFAAFQTLWRELSIQATLALQSYLREENPLFIPADHPDHAELRQQWNALRVRAGVTSSHLNRLLTIE